MSDLSKASGETETCHEPVPNCESTTHHDSGTGLASDQPLSVLTPLAVVTNPELNCDCSRTNDLIEYLNSMSEWLMASDETATNHEPVSIREWTMNHDSVIVRASRRPLSVLTRLAGVTNPKLICDWLSQSYWSEVSKPKTVLQLCPIDSWLALDSLIRSAELDCEDSVEWPSSLYDWRVETRDGSFESLRTTALTWGSATRNEMWVALMGPTKIGTTIVQRSKTHLSNLDLKVG